MVLARAGRLPDGVEKYRETEPFHAGSCPAGLRARHTTRRGVWGRLVVDAGRLVVHYFDCADPPQRALDLYLHGGEVCVFPPQAPHCVEFPPDLTPEEHEQHRFHVEFYRFPKED